MECTFLIGYSQTSWGKAVDFQDFHPPPPNLSDKKPTSFSLMRNDEQLTTGGQIVDNSQLLPPNGIRTSPPRRWVPGSSTSKSAAVIHMRFQYEPFAVSEVTRRPLSGAVTSEFCAVLSAKLGPSISPARPLPALHWRMGFHRTRRAYTAVVCGLHFCRDWLRSFLPPPCERFANDVGRRVALVFGPANEGMQ